MILQNGPRRIYLDVAANAHENGLIRNFVWLVFNSRFPIYFEVRCLINVCDFIFEILVNEIYWTFFY